jgi:flagellar capping protein FliD
MWWGIPGWALGVGIIIIASTLSKALVPYLKAQAHRVEREGSSDGDTARLSEQLAEVQQRLGEMEERLDFAERMIAQQRESERLGPPKS